MTENTIEASSPDNLDLKNLNLTIDSSLTSEIEKVYDLIRRNDNEENLNAYLETQDALNLNEILKNGDTILCIACNKGFEKIVTTLVDKYSADVNLCRSINSTSTSFSTITPTITISARRQSRLVNHSAVSSAKSQRGDSPLSICIKYGYESLAMYLIDKGADISGNDEPGSNVYPDFERSPLQDAIRLNRTKIVEKMLQSMFEKDDIHTIEWVFAKRYDILRQVLMTENLETIKVILPNILEGNKRIDGEMLIHILNYLLMKSKIQERKDKVNQILETVMEIGTKLDDEENPAPFEIYNLDVFVRGFLATLKALFNAVSSDDSRTAILSYRTSLFFFIMKYQKALVNFENFYADLDATFDFFYTKLKETGENVLKLVEYFITFYDTLITMNHIHLTASNVAKLLRLEHIKKLDILGEFLIQRSLTPLDLKEIARLKIKECMTTYNLYTINNDLPILDQNCKEFLYFV